MNYKKKKKKTRRFKVLDVLENQLVTCIKDPVHGATSIFHSTININKRKIYHKPFCCPALFYRIYLKDIPKFVCIISFT